MAQEKPAVHIDLEEDLAEEQEEHVVQLTPREAREKLPFPRCADTEAEDPFHTELLHVTERLSEFAVDYTPEAVNHNPEELEIAVTFDHRGGARWRSLKQYVAGSFSSKIKTPSGNTSGLISSFYLSSLEGDKKRDEIGFEFLGKDKTVIQTNFYTSGVGNREEIHELGFDSSEGFHDYTIRWYPSKIEWFVDGKLIRTASHEEDKPFPEKPSYLYAALWNAADVDEGQRAGPFVGGDEPYVLLFKNVVVPLCNLGEA